MKGGLNGEKVGEEGRRMRMEKERVGGAERGEVDGEK